MGTTWAEKMNFGMNQSSAQLIAGPVDLQSSVTTVLWLPPPPHRVVLQCMVDCVLYEFMQYRLLRMILVVIKHANKV